MSDNDNTKQQSDLLRQRGWSIQSEEDGSTITTSHKRKLENDNNKNDVNEQASTVPKRARLDSNYASDDSSVLFPTPTNEETQKKEELETISKKQSSSNEDDASKKNNDTTADNNKKAAQENNNTIQKVAQARLSKWAARLFDPDRPRGLIEPPKTIPLNDEFLKAFGKREKEHDETMGRTIKIDRRIEDEEEKETATMKEQQQAESSFEGTAKQEDVAASPKNKKSKKSSRKVKITNLKYTTTKIRLQAECSRFGPTEEVNLILDDNDNKLNKGRAYVTFESSAGSDACIVGLHQVDGRKVTVLKAYETSNAAAAGGTTKTPRSLLLQQRQQQKQGRYWGTGGNRDISFKCYRCGNVGHVEADCNNEPTAKPCPLCAAVGHELRECPIRAVCFNCGVPGHVLRECPRPRGLPQRRVCTICLQPDHTMWQCRGILVAAAGGGGGGNRHPRALPGMDQVVCMVCGRTGHYLCQDMKWFHGLNGVSCYNCGRPQHLGVSCDRPNLDVCSRYEEVAAQEVERASAAVMEDHGSSRGRGRNEMTRSDYNKNDDDDYNRRAKSMPPPQHRRRNNR